MTFPCENCPKAIKEEKCVSNGRYCPMAPNIGSYISEWNLHEKKDHIENKLSGAN